MAEVFNEGVGLLSEGDVSALLGSNDFWAMAPLQDARPNGGITAHVPPKTRSEAVSCSSTIRPSSRLTSAAPRASARLQGRSLCFSD